MKAVKRRIIIVLICVILAIPVTIHAQVNTYEDDAARPVDHSTEIVIKNYSKKIEGNDVVFQASFALETNEFQEEFEEFFKKYMVSDDGQKYFWDFSRYVQNDFRAYPSSAFALRSYSRLYLPEQKKVEPCVEIQSGRNCTKYFFRMFTEVSGILVMKKTVIDEALVSTVDKLSNRFAEGSRFALDKISLFREIDNGGYKEEVKDKLTEILLDKGYRVVAKEYFERLLKEQGGYSSGIYNDATTVQNNNFSAVGYLVNVKITESFVRLQVVNVSTGEYEGNVIVNF